MKYRRKVFEMNDAELECVAQNLGLSSQEAALAAGRKAERYELQEDIVQWLMSEGLSVRHNFLFYEDEESSPDDAAPEHGIAISGTTALAKDNVNAKFRRRSIYLLKRMQKCECCYRSIGGKPSAGDVHAAQSSSSSAKLASKTASSGEPPQKYVPSVDSLREASYDVYKQQLQNKQQYYTKPNNFNSLTKQQQSYYEQKNYGKRMQANGAVIREQPTSNAVFNKHRVYSDGMTRQRKSKGESLQFDCCCKSYFVECGRFCVELLRGT